MRTREILKEMNKLTKKTTNWQYPYVEEKNLPKNPTKAFKEVKHLMKKVEDLIYPHQKAVESIYRAWEETVWTKAFIKLMAKEMRKYGSHTHDCEWNNVVLGGSPEVEKKECD